MSNQDLINYITQSRASGVSDAQIRQALATQGWTQADLDQAFRITSAGSVMPQASQVSGNIYTKVVFIVLAFSVFFLFNNHFETKESLAVSLLNPCDEGIFEYFPKSKIDQVLGVTSQTITIMGGGTCIFSIDSGGIKGIFVMIIVSPTTAQAELAFEQHLTNINPNLKILNQGTSICSSYLSTVGEPGYVSEGQMKNYIFTISSSDVPYVSINDLEDILKYACDKVGKTFPEPVPPADPPPPSNVKCQNTGPIIDSYTPKKVSAGIALPFNPNIGKEQYASLDYVLQIKGSCLDGARLETNAPKLRNEQAIEFTGTTTSNNGKSVQVEQMRVKPFTKEGDVKITLTNIYGRSTSITINVGITGTQYLERRFKNENISFWGSWPKIDSVVLDIEKGIVKGLQTINKPSYRNLGIIADIYEVGYWESVAEKLCGVVWAAGCASSADNTIKIGAYPEEISKIILHESVHKLHFFFNGSYPPRLAPAVQFTNNWARSYGPNISQCREIPIKLEESVFLWAVTNTTVPKCTFIKPYGAYRFNLSNNIFWEDVATMVETREFAPSVLTQGDALNGIYAPLYIQKLNLLKQYDF